MFSEEKGPDGALLAGFLLRFLAALCVVLGTAALLFLLGGRGTREHSVSSGDPGHLPVGSVAPSFEARTVDGEEVTLPRASGEAAPATVLMLFAAWCPQSEAQATTVGRIQRQHGGDEVAVAMVGVDEKDGPSEVGRFAERHGAEGSAVHDPSLRPLYGVEGYPTIYVLDREGRIVGAALGGATEETYDAWVEKALDRAAPTAEASGIASVVASAKNGS